MNFNLDFHARSCGDSHKEKTKILPVINLCTRRFPSAFVSSEARRLRMILANDIINTMMLVFQHFPFLKDY